MKAALIAGALALVFLVAFVLRIETQVIGPTSADEVDDLQIQEAYLDRSTMTLVLVTRDQWSRLPLAPIIETNQRLRSIAPPPRDGNFLHWRSFTPGRPASEETKQLEPIAVATDQYASFGYYHYPPDGKPRRNSEEVVAVPDGFEAALFRSNTKVGQDNKTWFKSYLLATASRQPDGQFGVQFFYNPDTRQRLALQHPLMLVFFGPSFLALCIGLPLAFSRIPIRVAIVLFVVATVLHLLSFLIFVGVTRYGEAWSGYSSNHNTPYAHLRIGLFVLLVLFLIHLARNVSKHVPH